MNQTHALVIDDNPHNLKVLVQMLARQDVASTTVENPATLPGLLSSLQHIDVVFLDLEMPGMDGYRAKDLLKSHFDDTPIIAYTVHVSEINTVREMGFDGFLSKPLDHQRFPDLLRRILQGEHVWERS